MSESDGILNRPDVPGYEIRERLGIGGMGVVYKALQVRANRLVALKMILGGAYAHAATLERFRVEGQAVATLRHPNVVQIYDFGEVGGMPYFSLELLEGGTLKDRLAAAPMPPRPAAELLVMLASAISSAHRAGIVHRDLKPANVLFDTDGTPKVADFGLAKRLEAEDGQTLTGAGQVMGTPSYMAPEQAAGDNRAVGPAADVYALGAILYETLTVRPPFKGASTAETLVMVIHEDPVAPSRLQPKVPRDLETICLKCLHKEAQKRYGSAEELADDLRRYLANHPIRARRTPLRERTAKWVRRHPASAVLMALGVAATLAAVAAGWRYDSSVRRGERLEQQRVARLQRQATQELFRVQDALTRGDWMAAKDVASQWATKLEAESLLSELRVRAVDFREQAEREITSQGARDQDRRDFSKFLQLRDQALLQVTQFAGLDLGENLDSTRRAARAALAVFSAPVGGGGWVLAPRTSTLSPAERDEVAEGCYELLLILSEAVEEPDEGLRILDQADRLHLRPTQAYHLRRAACLDRRGEAADAERERVEARRLTPSTPSDFFLAGQERYKRRQWTEASHLFEAALRLQPDHFWAQCLSASCALEVNRPTEARGGLKACLQRQPKFAWLWILRGFATGQVAVMTRDLGEKRPELATGLRAEAEIQFEEAEADYRRAYELLQAKPQDDMHYVLLVNRGLMRLQRSRLDEAAVDLKEAIRINPRRFQAHAELGQVYRRQQRQDEAIAQFDEAIRLKPDWAPLYRGRADVELDRAELPEPRLVAALGDLERTIELEAPDNPVLARDHMRRGQLLQRAGRDEEALTAFEAALRVVPSFTEAQRLRLGILLKLDRYHELITACNTYLAQGAPSAELLELRGLARAREKDYVGAIGDYTQALAVQPGRHAVLEHRGWAYFVNDAPKLALHDFDELIRLEPKLAGYAHCGRGLTQVRLGNHRAAVADAEAALRLGQPPSRTFYLAARIYAQAARVASAEVRQQGWSTVTLVTRYQDRAVALAREAVNRQAPEQRETYLREVLEADPTLSAIRKRLRRPRLTDAVSSAVK